jgi:23S rRNA (cytosine1962-C5)-methyltransferase
MAYPQIQLKAGREKSLFYRHPWIFSGALQSQRDKEKIVDGSIVDVLTADGAFAARGYFNSLSNITVRILTFDEKELIDVDFFQKKITKAWDMRRTFIDEAGTNAYRVVFAESDGLPGLIVDKYDTVLVVQAHTMGMDMLKSMVVEALQNTLKPAAIYERSDVMVRTLEGLKDKPEGVLSGTLPVAPFTILEHGLKYLVDVAGGQKTGFFLDQRENRLALRKYTKDKTVLNLFCYTGGFSCSAFAGGASAVTSVDISEDATPVCRKNAELNGFDKNHTVVTQDVFAFLDKTIAAGTKFDVVVVDPPAFVKSQKNLETALKAYVRLNSMALRVLKDGGVLVSSSCSSYVSPERYRGVLFQSALKEKCVLKVLEQKSQPLDHPMNLYFPEGEYLKFFVLQKG